jgi:hypothetical protein
MDYRQEARDRFDKVMRVPDRIAGVACLISFALAGVLFLELINPSHTQQRHGFLSFYVTTMVCVVATYALYVAVRFVAATVVAFLAVLRRAACHPVKSVSVMALSIAESRLETRR